MDLFTGSPADRGGLLPGDFILTVDGTNIDSGDQLTMIIGGLEAGTTHDFGIMRYGERRRLTVKIGLRDDMDKVAQDKNLWPGMTVVDLTEDIRSQANIPSGVNGVIVGNILSQQAPTAIAGLQPGDVIVSIGDTKIRNMLDYYEALNNSPRGQVTFRINRGGTEVSIGVPR